MMPIEPLIEEHMVIEKMNQLLETEIEKMKKFNKANPLFIDTAVDFIKIYTDKTHHGKEDILFRYLEKKKLSPNHSKILEELKKEHTWESITVDRLAEAKNQYVKGKRDILNEIISVVSELVKFYPDHIKKEDKHFFNPVMAYFTIEEQDKMLQEFWDHDKTIIHERYENVIENLQNK
jgi:hemerythrin-like domain-containing protein